MSDAVIGVDVDRLDRLTAFARLFGYVRYFHPSDEASAIDWDRFAVLGVRAVSRKTDSPDLGSELKRLFQPIAPTVQIHRSTAQARPLSLPDDTAGLHPVAWQYVGLSDNARNVYRSARTYRTRESMPPEGFGTATQGIDAAPYAGQRIRLSADVRVDVSGTGNQGQLWLRIDRANQQPGGFFDNMGDRPILAADWARYGIEGEVIDDAVSIYFGCLLSGQGAVWVDDMSLEVQSDDGQWTAIDIVNPGFEADRNGAIPGWFTGSRGYTYVLDAGEPKAGMASMRISSDPSGALFDGAPAPGEYIDRDLGAGYAARIPLALFSDESGTLGNDDPELLAGLQAQLADIDPTSADDDALRIANVIIAWNVFRHFYPYFDVVDVDWNAVLGQSLAMVIGDDDEGGIEALEYLVERLHDGHARVSHTDMNDEVGFAFSVAWIEDRVVITHTADAHFEIGDVIVSVDGVPASTIVEQSEALISGSPQWKRVGALRRFAFGELATNASISLLRAGVEVQHEVTRDTPFMPTPSPREPIEELEPGIWYVDLDRAPMESIDEGIEVLAEAAGVVFDLRGYPKGNHDILRHLLDQADTSASWMQIDRIVYPDGLDVQGQQPHAWFLQPREPRISGRVAFITDGRAISYAESLMSFVEHYKLGEIVGQPTAGTNGNVNTVQLLAGSSIRYTGMRVVKHDGAQHHLVGIQPTVPVQRTIRGVIEGRDEFLDRALELVRTASD